MQDQTLLSEQEIIRNYIDGDDFALSVLINRYKDKIFTSIYVLLRNEHFSEDIFQDLFVIVIDKLKNNKYKNEGKFLQWSICIAHNLCLDHFKKEKRNSTLESKYKKDVFKIPVFLELNFDNSIIQEQTSDKINKLLDSIPKEQREVVILRYFAKLSFKEIAKITNCSNNTALGRMRYAILKMRKIIKEKQS